MPFNNPYTYAGHGGMDYAQPAYTPIRAVADGKITFSAHWTLRGGLTRTLTLDNGLQMMHCHLVNLNGPRVNSRVHAGDIIAYVGSTGFSTGNHLHHELWYRGVKQSGSKYWNWIDRSRVIGQRPPTPSGGGGSKPTPKPTPIPETNREEFMTFPPMIKQENSPNIWAIKPDGYKRLVLPTEMNVYKDIARKNKLNINDFIAEGPAASDIPGGAIPGK